jgi:hypothetical protein
MALQIARDLPPWYGSLYDTAEASAEFRRTLTANAPAMSADANVVAVTADDFHRLYNLFAWWVNQGEPGVAEQEASVGSAASEAGAAIFAIPAEALRDACPHGTLAAELPLIRARCAFLRFVIAYNRGTAPSHMMLRAAPGRHHDGHPTADVPPPAGMVTSYEWAFAKTTNGYALARRADDAFARSVLDYNQRRWEDLPAD